ncbi:MAG TPA: hypothetical protein VKT20_10810 [Candidatus Dormibacteraeota bacterium]|nr:hypothetical protein [Candidatus Dormibacteraeota bacterium]
MDAIVAKAGIPSYLHSDEAPRFLLVNPIQRRVLRRVAYIWVAAGVFSLMVGVIGIGIAAFGPAAQRANAVGDIAVGFGGAFANGLVGGGLLVATRSPARPNAKDGGGGGS